MSFLGSARKKTKKVAHSFEKKSWYHKQFHQAVSLVKKLWSLRLVKIIVLVLFFLLITPFIVFIILRPKTPDHFNYGITFSNRYAQELGLDWQDTYLKIIDELKV
ncbi:hypothetical protein KC571_01850, partial [candidate division WWE3 bacterium]|nr:hypothetical protein [candidate division WWE3 bacterium]